MKVDVLPIGPSDSDSLPFAEELAQALRRYALVSAAVREGPPDAASGEGASISHLVCDRPDTGAVARAAERATGPLVVTVTGVDPGDSQQLYPGVSVWHTLTGTAMAVLASGCPDPERVRLLPCPAPEIAPAGGGAHMEPEPIIAVMLAPGSTGAVVAPAIGALADLGPRYRLDIVHAPGACVEEWRREVAAQSVADRVTFEPAATRAQVAARIARAEAAVVSSDHVAGIWHALTPLALGVPMLAESNPLTYDLLLRAHCVRLVNPGEPGHVAACLKAIVANEIGKAEMTERSLAYTRRTSWAAAAQTYRQLYEGLLADASAPSRVQEDQVESA